MFRTKILLRCNQYLGTLLGYKLVAIDEAVIRVIFEAHAVSIRILQIEWLVYEVLILLTYNQSSCY